MYKKSLIYVAPEILKPKDITDTRPNSDQKLRDSMDADNTSHQINGKIKPYDDDLKQSDYIDNSPNRN